MINKLKSLVNKAPAQKVSDARLNANCTIPEVNKWIMSDFILNTLIPVVGTRPFPLDELMLMSSAVVYSRPSYIFEWGTHIGKSARIFYETTKVFNIHCSVHSIDLPDDVTHVEHPKNERGMLVRGIKEVTLHQGDGVTKALEIYNTLDKEAPALFFVDGDHEYESVKRELEMILNTVKNPFVLLHDTFYQSKESKYNVGPFNAINDVLGTKANAYQLISTQMGLPGMTFLYKK